MSSNRRQIPVKTGCVFKFLCILKAIKCFERTRAGAWGGEGKRLTQIKQNKTKTENRQLYRFNGCFKCAHELCTENVSEWLSNPLLQYFNDRELSKVQIENSPCKYHWKQRFVILGLRLQMSLGSLVLFSDRGGDEQGWAQAVVFMTFRLARKSQWGS